MLDVYPSTRSFFGQEEKEVVYFQIRDLMVLYSNLRRLKFIYTKHQKLGNIAPIDTVRALRGTPPHLVLDFLVDLHAVSQLSSQPCSSTNNIIIRKANKSSTGLLQNPLKNQHLKRNQSAKSRSRKVQLSLEKTLRADNYLTTSSNIKYEESS